MDAGSIDRLLALREATEQDELARLEAVGGDRLQILAVAGRLAAIRQERAMGEGFVPAFVQDLDAAAPARRRLSWTVALACGALLLGGMGLLLLASGSDSVGTVQVQAGY